MQRQFIIPSISRITSQPIKNVSAVYASLIIKFMQFRAIQFRRFRRIDFYSHINKASPLFFLRAIHSIKKIASILLPLINNSRMSLVAVMMENRKPMHAKSSYEDVSYNASNFIESPLVKSLTWFYRFAFSRAKTIVNTIHSRFHANSSDIIFELLLIHYYSKILAPQRYCKYFFHFVYEKIVNIAFDNHNNEEISVLLTQAIIIVHI